MAADRPEATPAEPTLQTVTLTLCSLCLSGAGGECHVPGCALWLNRAPDIPVTEATPCRVCGDRGWHTAGGNDPMACGACPAGEAWYSGSEAEATPVPDRHAEGLEAAADALLADSGLPKWGAHRGTVERRQRLAIDAYLSATGLVSLGAVVEALRGRATVSLTGARSVMLRPCSGRSMNC